jgi:hypothetical protein
MDPCAKRQIVGSKSSLLMIYMDDILIFADDVDLKHIKSSFKEEFTWITMNAGNVLSYLGMQTMLEQVVVIIDMSYYLEKVLKRYSNQPPCSTLGKKTLFAVDDTVEPLVEVEPKVFHVAVARVLYLSRELGQIL